ncbi:hypothetical protein RIVM261_045360 [Rivularia sp. IAM M-261]|nr:hypothetical protein RIVM261_045360 [Rivularia sp. IAM M-261]
MHSLIVQRADIFRLNPDTKDSCLAQKRKDRKRRKLLPYSQTQLIFYFGEQAKEIFMSNNYYQDRIRLLEKLATLPNPIEFLDKFDRVCPKLDTEPVIEVNIFDEVQAVGISLNHTLKDRIMRCNVQQVRLAIEEYKRVSQQEVIDNPGGMFYRILEKKSNGFGFF